MRSDIDRQAKLFRGNLDDIMFPAESSSSKPSDVQKKPSSPEEAGKKKKGPSLKKIEPGPKPAIRHVGKRKPVVVVDPHKGSSSKEPSGSKPDDDGVDELDKIAKDEPEPSVFGDDQPISVPARRKKQDSESQIEKLGSDALEPRRVSVPLPGSEVQAMTPALRKMLKKLEDTVELYEQLHVKHYHMSPTQFRRRTSMLGLPDSVYEKYEDVVNKCRVCSTSVAPPPRARI